MIQEWATKERPDLLPFLNQLMDNEDAMTLMLLGVGAARAEMIERSKRLGHFCGYHWYGDDKHFDPFIKALEEGKDIL